MTEKDKEIQTLRSENKALQARVTKLEQEIVRWEKCHEQDMEDNVRLMNQVNFLIGSDPI